MEETKFKEAYELSLAGKVDKKGTGRYERGVPQTLNYISWATAWALLKGVYPDAQYEVIRTETARPWFVWDGQSWVEVRVTAGGVTHTMLRPVIDNRNVPIKMPTSADINTAIMRTLAKCIALFGVGLKVYEGEDIPEDVPVEPAAQAVKAPGAAPVVEAAAPTSEPEPDNRVPELTEAELRSIGCKDPGKTISWLEKKFGAPIAHWTGAQTEEARAMLYKKAGLTDGAQAAPTPEPAPKEVKEPASAVKEKPVPAPLQEVMDGVDDWPFDVGGDPVGPDAGSKKWESKRSKG